MNTPSTLNVLRLHAVNLKTSEGIIYDYNLVSSRFWGI